MKRTIITLLLVGCIGGFIFRGKKIAVATTQVDAENYVDVEEFSPQNNQSKEFDFGKAKGGTTIRHVYAVTNKYDRDLKIVKIMTSCQCTTLSAKQLGVFAVNKPVNFPVSINLPETGGSVMQEVNVVFEDKTVNPLTLTLIIKGEAIKEFDESLNFGKIKLGSDAREIDYIRTTDDAPVVITKLQYDKSQLNVEIVNGTKEKHDAQLIVSVPPTLPYGGFSYSVNFATSTKPDVFNVIKVIGSVSPPLETKDKEISFGLIGKGQEVARDIEIYSPYDKDIEIEKIELSREGRIDVAKFPIGKSVKIPMVIDGNFAGRILKGNIHVVAKVDGKEEQADIVYYAMKGN